MRFADKGYFIEAYVKCANCGVLVYDRDDKDEDPEAVAPVYCSSWCREWAARRNSGNQSQGLPLPRGSADN